MILEIQLGNLKYLIIENSLNGVVVYISIGIVKHGALMTKVIYDISLSLYLLNIISGEYFHDDMLYIDLSLYWDDRGINVNK